MKPSANTPACSGKTQPPTRQLLRIAIPDQQVLDQLEELPDSPSCKRSPEIMGALYEDVEKFFGDIFAGYGRFVARWPIPFVVAPLLICSLLGLGMLELKYETNLESLYTPIDSTAAKDKLFLQEIFSVSNNHHFYPHQALKHCSYGEVIISPKPTHLTSTPSADEQKPANILTRNAMKEIDRLMDYILNISVSHRSRLAYFTDICAQRSGQCVIIGQSVVDDLLWNKEDKCYNLVQSNVSVQSNASDLNFVLADFTTNPANMSDCVSAIAMRLRFHLVDNKTNNEGAQLSWQKQFLKELEAFETNYTLLDYTVSAALDIELSRHVGTDTRFLLVSIVTMLLYATLQGAGGNWVSNHVTLAYAGVFAALLSIVAAFGFLSICGLRFVNMSGVMPFLVIGIGVDDMFQLMTEWRHTNMRESIESRMGNTLRSAAVSITITSLTDLMAFCIGATSPFISVKHFCACSGIAIFFCYINQLTFFSGVIVLHARRIQDGRHCVTCLKTKSRQDLIEDQRSGILVFLCSGHPPRKFGEEGGLCGAISRGLYTYYPKFILNWVTKCCVILLFGAYITLSAWGASQLQNGFKLEDVISEESYVYEYITKERCLFPDSGPAVMFVINEPKDYSSKEVQNQISNVITAASHLEYVNDDVYISWLKHFLEYSNDTTFKSEKHFIKHLQDPFLREFPEYVNDVKLSRDNSSIVASRFYVECKQTNDSRYAATMMEDLRIVANNSQIPFIAFSPDFLYFEHYVCILKNTLLAVGVAIIGMLFVALVFIPHPIAVSAVTLSMISVVLGMVGFMTFWGLALSAITTIQIILSVGICVDSTVHISHAFMTATGKNRNERVSVALEKVGIPILNGAISSLLGILMLALGSSYIFTSFFKTMFLVVVLGLLHSLVFLPVMLSFIGPRRTSKPRVFIPVSPSSRSLQDIYRANSVMRPPPADPPVPYEPVIISANLLDSQSLKTRSLTDITSESQGQKMYIAKEPRRVSFAVGEESKYHLEKSFLETKVDDEIVKRSSGPMSPVCEADEDADPYSHPDVCIKDNTHPRASDWNDNIEENSALLNQLPKVERVVGGCMNHIEEEDEEYDDAQDDDAQDSSPLTQKRSTTVL